MEIRQVRSVYAIVLGWNRREDTIECLASLQDSDFSDLNLVLVDNHSEDDTVAAVRQKFPQVHVIENERNSGFAEGNNIGIRYALANGADYVFLLNNDARVQPNTIALLAQAGEQNPGIGILSPAVESFYDPKKVYVGSRIYWKGGAVADLEATILPQSKTLETDYASACALLIKSQIVRQIGLLDPDYFAYMEDVDWSMRCRKTGYQVVVVPQARALHKGAMDQPGSKSPIASFLFWRNRFLFMRKHARLGYWPGFLKSISRELVMRVSEARTRGDNETAGAMIDGFWAGLAGQKGAPRVRSPRLWGWVVGGHIPFWDWLTRWIYFWDYRRAKSHRINGMHNSMGNRG